MPSASVKSDSTGSSETQDPLGRLYLLVEKKIRNLEKRKNKLENYKAELVDGKELNEDQQKAVDAYDAVIATLDLCKEFEGQVNSVIGENAKFAKLQQKKQQEEKVHHELEKIKQVLKVQDVFIRISQPEIRADFSSGTNGAIELKAEKLKHLDALHKLVTPPMGPERERTSNGFKGQLNTASENLLSLIDGKNKPASPGTTYRDMKTLVYQIANCSYPKVPRSTQISNTSSPLPEPESQAQPQKTKKSKANKGKNQIPNGTPATEGTTPKHSSKNNSRIASASVSSSTKSVSLPPSSGVASIVVSSVPSQVSSPSKSVSKNTVTQPAPSGKSKKRETRSSEGPPPGITPPTVQGAQQSSANLISAIPPQVRPGLGAATNSTLGHANAYFNVSQSPTVSQTNSRGSLDINDLVTAGSFNFLQESQVVGPDASTSQAAVYVDPAVVSFCSMKPESLVQLHEQQQQQQKQLKQLTVQPVPPVLPSPAAAVDVSSHQHQAQHAHIPSETFINQAYVTSSGPAGYSQVVPSYSSTAGVTAVETGASNHPPVPIPLPKEEKKSFVEPSSSWAAQEDTDGWGAPDPPANSSVNGGDSNSWGVVEGNESATWGDSCDKPQQDVEERRGGGGFRGMSRGRGSGSRGSSGIGGGGSGYRGGRGSYNNYQGGGRGNSFGGGNGYTSRGGRGSSSNGGGYRGRGNFSRTGRGSEGNARGGYEGNTRGGYEGNTRGGYEGNTRGGYEGNARGGYEGNTRGGYEGNTRGGYEGNARGGYEGSTRGGYEGSTRGGYEGSTRGGYEGSTRGGYEGSTRGGYEGSTRGGYEGSTRGGYEGNTRGGYEGSTRGGMRRGGGGFQGNQQQRNQY